MASQTSRVISISARQAPPGLLQQRVALAQDPLEVDTERVVLAVQCHERVVEEAAPLPRPAFHQRQVVGREDTHLDDTEEITSPLQALPVDLHTVAPGPGQLGLGEDLPAVVVHDLGP